MGKRPKLFWWKKLLIFFLSLSLLFSQFLSFSVKPAFAVTQTYNLATSTNYNIRIDGVAMNDKLALTNLTMADLDNDGKQDIVVAAPYADNNSRTDSGSLYIIYHTLLEKYSGTGNNIDLANPANYNLRYDGAGTNHLLGHGNLVIADLDGDGKQDILVGAYYAGNNERTGSGSLYVINNTLINNHVGTGNNTDLATSSNYSLRYDGAKAGDCLSWEAVGTADLDNDGKQDILVGAYGTDNNSRNISGSLYVIYNTLIDDYSGTGKNIDLATSSNYNLRYDGAKAGDDLSQSGFRVADLDNDGRQDIVVAAWFADNNSRTDSGSFYVIYNTLIDDYTGTGKNIDLATASNYNLRYDGAGAGDYLFYCGGIKIADLDNDGKQDILAGAIMTSNNSRTHSGSLYVIYNTLIDDYSGTGKNIDLAISSNYNLRYDGAIANQLLSDIALGVTDFDNDGKQDIFIGGPDLYIEPQNGVIYVIYNTLIDDYSGTGNNIDMANSSNYSLKYIGPTGGHLNFAYTNFVDFNNDGSKDLILPAHESSFNSRAKSGSLYIIYNFPHTITATSVSSYITADLLSVTGTAAVSADSTTSLSGVQYSLDSNSPSSTGWTACSGTSSFACSLSGLSEGGHTVYLRAYDTNTSYTASYVYSSVSFTYDKTSPVTSWTNDAGASRTFSSPQANVFSTSLHLPSFSFTKAKDTTAGISKYQILIKKEKQADGTGNQYYTYIDDIPHDRSGAGAGTILDETTRYTKYTGDDIFVYSKRTQDQLANGGYKWKVRVIDKAGNSTDTQEKILLINTHQANFSGTWFPLVLLSKSPSFYGITTVGSIVTLTLKQNNQTILTKTTTANAESRFGINLTKSDNLKSGTYTVLLSATNQHADYIELPEFTFTYGKKTLVTVTAAKTSQPTPTQISNQMEEPVPTPRPTPIPEPTAKPKHCLFFWCW